MGSSLAQPHDLIQRMAVALKQWLQEVAPFSIPRGHPLGKNADGRTISAITSGRDRTPGPGATGETRASQGISGMPGALEALIARKHRATMCLRGRTGGIECTVSIGGRGDVAVSFKSLPERLVGTKPILTFPSAARIDTITWESGPRPGIVQAADAVTTTGELECRVARVAFETNGLPALFGRIRILSQEGDGHPACSIGVAVEECRD